MSGAMQNRLLYEDVYSSPSKIQKYIEGTIAQVQHPVFGSVEVMYAAAAETLVANSGVKFVPSLKADGSGFTFGASKILLGDLAVGNVFGCSISKESVPAGYFAWFAIGGIFLNPLSISVTADTRTTHASSVDSALSSGYITQKVVSACMAVKGDRTVTKKTTIQANTPEVYVNSVADLNIGMAVTGTGIPATTYIQTIDEALNIVSLTNSPTDTRVSTLTFNSVGTGSLSHMNVHFAARSCWQAAF